MFIIFVMLFNLIFFKRKKKKRKIYNNNVDKIMKLIFVLERIVRNKNNKK